MLLKFFRIGNKLFKTKSILFRPYKTIYKFLIEPYFSVNLPLELEVGSNFRIFHYIGLVIHPKARLGNDVILRHNTTIGNDGHSDEAPTIGNNVDVGAGTLIIGNITIGDEVVIAAGSIVTKNVPSGTKLIQKKAL